VLANWLVCLGVWMSARLKSESAKLLMIWWCMFTFIACSFEHSVANMSGLLVGLLLDHAGHSGITWLGYAYNLALATAGNIVGGAGLVAMMYWFASPAARASRAADVPGVALQIEN
jgi:nitrite transporter NirC